MVLFINMFSVLSLEHPDDMLLFNFREKFRERLKVKNEE
jgi:hypothetical protein